ncbi:MAG: CHAT domain-containing protein, partial [bacterium]|nr:CHAT domain-containing protein [bacterium]
MAFSKYLDCELRLTDHDQARLSVGGRDYSGHPALDEARRHQLRKAALDPTQYGTLLFGALFPGDGDDLLTGYREGLAIARHDKRRLRFRLDIGPTAPPELHDLHWELLCDPKRKLALGRSRDTAFSRYLSVPLAPGTAVVERPKLLVVLAAPKDLAAYELPELDRDQMQQSIRKALSPLAGGVDCELLDAPATAERIRDRLVAGGFHIMHLQAHGLVDPERATANLVLEGDDHRATFIEEELVAEIMEGDRDLRLVTLIACHGGVHTAADPFSGLGPALVRRGIPAVVAMRRAISVAAAARFTEHLYLNLARSGQIDTAVNEARLQLHLAGPNLVEWGTPALFMRLREGLLWQAPAPDRDLRPGLVDHAELGYLTEPSQGAREIAEVLSRGEAVLVLGSALPVRAMEAERRTAEQVICGHLADQLTTPQAGRSLAVIARELEMESGREAMLEHLARAVRKPGNAPREIFRRLARLPFPVVVTTGYDAFLEEELTRAERTVHRLLNGWKIPEAIAEDGLVIRLFGGLEQMSSIVVTEDDQWQFFRSFHSLADRVKSWFATRSLIFVGCDPDEEGFRRLVSEIERFRVRRTRGWYLVTTEASLYAARWAESKGVRLIDAEPGPFLGLVEEALIELRREGGQTEAPPAPAKLPSRPYKFLNYFETEDAAIFFGRREETAKLASKIHAYPLNLLYAPSGCGKTSLIHAGLIPVLRQAGYCPLYTRVYDDPAGEIRRAVVAAGSEGGGAVAGEGPLEELLPRSASVLGRPLVVFVDQFEEIFIRYDREVRERFAATLRRCLDEGRGQVRFVLSLREDFLARLSEFRERLPTIFHNELRLDPLGEEESREAIVEPARLLDLEVEPQLVDRLIEDLTAEGIDPPQLQIVCDTLYDALPPGERRLTLKSYRSLGETRKILGGYLERVLRELPPEERQPTREILKALVTSEETKSLCRIADLARIAGCGEAEAARILAELANRRLIRRVPHEEGFWYELTHEYLVEEISRWLS